eukprot:8219341-Lingulodinium_polyedra.AAC.1
MFHAVEQVEQWAGRIARRAIAADSVADAARRPSAIAAMLYANGTCKIGPGSPAEWRNAGPMAGQNPDQMQRYL